MATKIVPDFEAVMAEKRKRDVLELIDERLRTGVVTQQEADDERTMICEKPVSWWNQCRFHR